MLETASQDGIMNAQKKGSYVEQQQGMIPLKVMLSLLVLSGAFVYLLATS